MASYISPYPTLARHAIWYHILSPSWNMPDIRLAE